MSTVDADSELVSETGIPVSELRLQVPFAGPYDTL
jgi:hypothetical protein